MTVAAVDFETYYDDECSVVPLGTVAYTLHPKFDAYMVSIYSEEVKYVGPLDGAPWYKISGYTWVSHNAGFDQAVYDWYHNKIGKKAWWPYDWHCTSAMSCYLGAPRDLGGAAKCLLKKELSKDMRKWMKGRTWEEAVKEGKAEAMKEYAARDASICYELWKEHSHKWPDHERLLSQLTYSQGAEGIYIDKEKLDKGISDLSRIIFETEQQIPWVKEGLPPTSPTALKKLCIASGIAPPKSLSEDDEECQKWEEVNGKKYPWIAAMRQWRKTNIVLQKLQTMKRRILQDGCMTYSLKYFGAHTGRWSGDAGFNIQNLHQNGHEGVSIRNLLRSRPGKKLIVCDLAQIEPRVLAWASGDQKMLEKLREGFSPYEAHARLTMKWEGGPLKKEDPKMYQLAKFRVLGLGYGCGAAKAVILAKMMGIDLSLSDAQKVVTHFRSTNPAITKFWGVLEWHFRRSCIKRPGHPNEFEMELPSGRIMLYRNTSANHGYQAQNIMGGPLRFFWGGSLTENFVQATARDVFAHGLLELHKEKIKVLFHVHDEFVCEVEPSVKPEEIVKIVTRVPSWLEGCPVEAEATETEFYTK